MQVDRDVFETCPGFVTLPLAQDTGKADELVVGRSNLNKDCRDLSSEERKRWQSKVRQQRCRERKKAAELALSAQVDHLSRKILAAKHEVGEKVARSLALRARNAELTLRLSEVSRYAPGFRELNERTASTNSDPNQVCVPAVPPSLQVPQRVQQAQGATTPGTHAPPSTCSNAASCASSACSIFAAERHQRACKYERLLSVSHVDTRQPFVHALTSYRCQVAEQLKCRVDDIAWRLQSKLYPDLTAEGGMCSRLKSPESVAKLTTLWLAALIETALLLAVVRRLERLRDEAPGPWGMPHIIIAPRPPLPSVNASEKAWHSLTGAASAPASSAETSESARTRWNAEGALNQAYASANADGALGLSDEEVSSVPAWAFDDPPPPGATDVDIVAHNMHSFLLSDAEQGGVSKEAVQPRSRGLQQTVRKVFADVFAAHSPWLTAAEVTRFCRRLQRSVGRGGGAMDALTGGGSSATLTHAAAFASVFAALNDVLKAVLLDVQLHPLARKVPATPQAIQDALDATEKRLAAVIYEEGFVCSTINTDNPVLVRGLSLGFMAITLGYVEFEKLNVTGFGLLELSEQQKAAVAHLWAAFRSRQRCLVAEFDRLARQLLATPSVAELQLNTTHALLQMAERMHAHDTAFAAAIGAADDAGEQSLRLGGDPFSGRWRAQSASPRGNAAVMHGGEESSAAKVPERRDWTRQLLGVSPEATDAAARLLRRLKEVQELKNGLHSEFRCLLLDRLTIKQNATLVAGLMPFQPDVFRIAGMASTDVCCRRVFGRPAICG